jgi:hypothetical protein
MCEATLHFPIRLRAMMLNSFISAVLLIQSTHHPRLFCTNIEMRVILTDLLPTSDTLQGQLTLQILLF